MCCEWGGNCSLDYMQQSLRSSIFPDSRVLEVSGSTNDPTGIGDVPLSPGRSLGHALADVPTELGLPSAIGFRVVVEGRRRELRASLKDEVYRIGREAIFNAYRHSHAKDIETQIEYRANELRVVVRDNGCGIDPQGPCWAQNEHWGLQGMRERAERIGARLRLFSRVGLGTEVELGVPGWIAFEESEFHRAC